MEQANYLIDTNAIIDFMASGMPEPGMSFMAGVIDTVPNISIISKIELLGFDGPTNDMELLEDFVNHSNIYHLDDHVVDECILLRKLNKIRLPDAIIAATAKVNSFHLITRNTRDFESLDKELHILNPHHIKA